MIRRTSFSATGSLKQENLIWKFCNILLFNKLNSRYTFYYVTFCLYNENKWTLFSYIFFIEKKFLHEARSSEIKSMFEFCKNLRVLRLRYLRVEWCCTKAKCNKLGNIIHIATRMLIYPAMQYGIFRGPSVLYPSVFVAQTRLVRVRWLGSVIIKHVPAKNSVIVKEYNPRACMANCTICRLFRWKMSIDFLITRGA
jgi:hypothetical protein